MKIIKEKTVSFTGHRRLQTLNFQPDKNLLNVIRTELYYCLRDLYKDGFRTFLSGMALGWDMLAAEVVLEFKKHHNDVQLYAIIPFPGQELRYSAQDKLRYKHIFDRVDGHTIVADEFSNAAYFKRNDYLLDNSSEVVCYYTGEKGGTEYTYNKAVKAGVPITNLYTELSDYFANQSIAKQTLQQYSTIPSIQFNREGIAISGADEVPLTVHFEEIESIDNTKACLNLTLRNGVMIRASLVSDDCKIKLPDDITQPPLIHRVLHKLFCQ